MKYKGGVPVTRTGCPPDSFYVIIMPYCLYKIKNTSNILLKYSHGYLLILVAMGECPQTCMIKARIAPRFGAPAMLHTFVPRPAAAALAALRCSVLMCGRSENVRKCSSELGICGRFPRCFNHTFFRPFSQSFLQVFFRSLFQSFSRSIRILSSTSADTIMGLSLNNERTINLSNGFGR